MEQQTVYSLRSALHRSNSRVMELLDLVEEAVDNYKWIERRANLRLWVAIVIFGIGVFLGWLM